MDFVGTAEAAQMLGTSKKTVMRYASAGILKAERKPRGFLGRYHWIIERQSVEQLLKQHNQE